MTDPTDKPLPDRASGFATEYPTVWKQYTELGRASSEAGPIEDEPRRLVKLALAIATESEGATHSHVRRGLDEGIPPETLKHVAVLAVPTLGFPKAMAAMSWIEDLTEE